MNDNINYNLVDVLYLDYILYKIAESYKYNIQDKLTNNKDNIEDNNLQDVMIDKLICKSLMSKLQVKYDEEILLKIIYVRLLQLLIKYQKDEKTCIKKIIKYLNTVKSRHDNIKIEEFTNKNISDVLLWLDKLYNKFDIPYLYDVCKKKIIEK